MSDEEYDNERPIEPSLQDALMPEKETPTESRERPMHRDSFGETASLQDALLPEDHVPVAPPASEAPEAASVEAPPEKPAAKATAPRAQSSHDGPNYVVQSIVALSIVAGFVVVFFVGRLSNNERSTPARGAAAVGAVSPVAREDAPIEEAPENAPVSDPKPTVDWGDPGPMGIVAIQEQGRIIDVHEHIESLEEAPKFIAAMDALGIQKMCLMGTSKFTLTLNESFGFTRYDENNEELITIMEAYPGRFEAWPTLNPKDPDKLAKIQGLVDRGATGVKLYIGHGYINKDRSYMFHTVAMDDPGMLPFYAWCEENRIPLAFHVNPYKDKTGFAQEFIAVLTQYPDLKVIAPHFILSSVKSSRLEELLDTFPNLYTDVSFGDYFMKERLTYISKYPKKFKRIFSKYPNRFMFAADLVMIKGRHDEWASTQLQSYIDMLSKETYTTKAIPGVTLKGLALPDELLSRVLFRNYLEFRVKQPEGTKITREIDWVRMGVEPVQRRSGQAFPPKPKTR
jgi:predicted TIM-barrel fold metal-dependent hydrolase